MMHHATHRRLTADSMQGCLEICRSVCGAAIPAADPMRACLEICGSVCGAACMLNIGCRADVGCLAICISVRGAAFILNIGCRSDTGLPRDMRICMRGCNAGCGSNARLPRNLRTCTWGYIYAEHRKKKNKLECGPMPNVMAALPNTDGAVWSTP